MAVDLQQAQLFNCDEPIVVQQRPQHLSEQLQKSKTSIGAFCSCCYESLTSNAVTISQCRHTYHHQCLLAWFTVSRKQGNRPGCPLCRVPCKEEDLFPILLSSGSDPPPALVTEDEEDARLQAKQLRQLLLQEREEKATTQAALEKTQEQLHALQAKATAAEQQHASAVSQLSEEVQKAERRLQQERDEARAREEAHQMEQRLLLGKLQEAEREKQQLSLSKLLLTNNVGLSNEEIQEKMLRLRGLTAEEKLKAQIGTLEFCKRDRDRLLADNRIVKEENGALRRKLIKMRLLLQRLLQANTCASASTSSNTSTYSSSNSHSSSRSNKTPQPQGVGSPTDERSSKTATPKRVLPCSSVNSSSSSDGGQIAAAADIWSSVGLHGGVQPTARSVKKKRGKHPHGSTSSKRSGTSIGNSSSICSSGSSNKTCVCSSSNSSYDSGGSGCSSKESHAGQNCNSSSRRELRSRICCNRGGSITNGSNSASRWSISGTVASGSSVEDVETRCNNSGNSQVRSRSCNDTSRSSSSKKANAGNSRGTEAAAGSRVPQQAFECLGRRREESLQNAAGQKTPLRGSGSRLAQTRFAALQHEGREEPEDQQGPEYEEAAGSVEPEKGGDGGGEEVVAVDGDVSSDSTHTAAAPASCCSSWRSPRQFSNGSIDCSIDPRMQFPTSNRRDSSRTPSAVAGDEMAVRSEQGPEDEAEDQGSHRRTTRDAVAEARGSSHVAELERESVDFEGCLERNEAQKTGSPLSASAAASAALGHVAATRVDMQSSGFSASPVRSLAVAPTIAAPPAAPPSPPSPVRTLSTTSAMELSSAGESSPSASVSACSAAHAAATSFSSASSSVCGVPSLSATSDDVATPSLSTPSLADPPGMRPCAEADASAATAAASSTLSSVPTDARSASSTAPAAAASAAAASTSAACPEFMAANAPLSSSSHISPTSCYPPRAFIPASLLAITPSPAAAAEQQKQQEAELLQLYETTCQQQQQHTSDQQRLRRQDEQHKQQQEQVLRRQQTVLQQATEQQRPLETSEQRQHPQETPNVPPVPTPAAAAAKPSYASSGTLEAGATATAASGEKCNLSSAETAVGQAKDVETLLSGNGVKKTLERQPHLGCLLSRRQPAASRATKRGLPQSIFPANAFSLRLMQRGPIKTGSCCSTTFKSSYASLGRLTALRKADSSLSKDSSPAATAAASSVAAGASTAAHPSVPVAVAHAESTREENPTPQLWSAAAATATAAPVGGLGAAHAHGAAAAARAALCIAGSAACSDARRAGAAIQSLSSSGRPPDSATETHSCLSFDKGVLRSNSTSAESPLSPQPVRNRAAWLSSPSRSGSASRVASASAAAAAAAFSPDSLGAASPVSPACAGPSTAVASFGGTDWCRCSSSCSTSLRKTSLASTSSSLRSSFAAPSPTTALCVSSIAAASTCSVSSVATASEAGLCQQPTGSALLPVAEVAAVVQPDTPGLRQIVTPCSSSTCLVSSDTPVRSSTAFSSSFRNCSLTSATAASGAKASTERASRSPLRIGSSKGSHKCSADACSRLRVSDAARRNDLRSLHSEEAEGEISEVVILSSGSDAGNDAHVASGSVRDESSHSSTISTECSNRSSSHKSKKAGGSSSSGATRLHSSSSCSCSSAGCPTVVTGRSSSGSTESGGKSVRDTFSFVTDASAAAGVADFESTSRFHSSSHPSSGSFPHVRHRTSGEETCTWQGRREDELLRAAGAEARGTCSAEGSAKDGSAAGASKVKNYYTASVAKATADRIASFEEHAVLATKTTRFSYSCLAGIAEGDSPSASRASAATTNGHSSTRCESTAKKAKEGWGCLQIGWKPGILPGGKKRTRVSSNHSRLSSTARRKKRVISRRLPFQ